MGNFFVDAKNEFEEHTLWRIVAAAIFVYLLMKCALPVVLPFVLSCLFVTWTRPFLNRCCGRNKTARSLLMSTLLILIACIPLAILFLLWQAGINFLSIGMDYVDIIQEQCLVVLHTGCGYLQDLSGIESTIIEARILRTAEGIGAQMSSRAIPAALTISGDMLVRIGYIGVLWAVFFIFSILLAKDYEELMDKFERTASFKRLLQIYDKTVKMLLSYFKAQLIIMFVIGGICSIVFWQMKFTLPFLWGYLVGFLDMLPFIGTGITLIPLAVVQFLLGCSGKGIMLLLLYLTCYLVREFMEPRLIGRRVGIHPLIVLISVFVGVRLYGLPGIITGPLSFLLVAELAKKHKPLDKW